MPTQLIAKLIELAYNETQSDLAHHEIEDRLLDNLLGKNLDFTTEQGEQATILFHSIGRGKESPSTVVTLQVEGIEFNQDAERLTLDLRYIFYQEYGYNFLFSGTSTKFLITSPFVQRLGPANILIEFAIYGNTVNQVNRCLSILAEVIRVHQATRHQTAIEWYDDHENKWEGDPEITLEEPIRETVSIDDPIEYIYESSNDESYIEDYIRYVDNPRGEIRNLIDNRNTYARSEL
ncbi:hypothetical protein [Haloplanus salinarum]|uniref:hypothetical protein n=1 Tax=Haloplanus salinarum TaxID=1912324 RepID=UPI00214CAB08|nr:hypothetical protein [Haloplanus salinarum]